MQKRFFILLFVLCLITAAVIFFARHDIARLFSKVKGLFEEQTPLTQTDEPLKDFIKITFLNIGQGDATFIEFPNGEQMLVDCAIDARILEALGRVMPYNDHTIDYIVATHPDKDHYGGCVDVLAKYEVKHVLFNEFRKEGNQFVPIFLQAIQDEKTADFTLVNKESKLTIASTTLHFLYPDAPLKELQPIKKISEEKISNNTSIVFTLEYGQKKVLFTGDAEFETEAYLIQKYGHHLDSDVLKVGHHGSKNSSGDDFLKLVTPQIATISSGKDNSYGHPTPRALKRLQRSGAEVWRTDQKGDILVLIKQNTLYVSGD